MILFYYHWETCYSKSNQEGGPIGLVQNGDIITIDIQKRKMDVQLSDEVLEQRRKNWTPPAYKADRGVLYKVHEYLDVTLFKKKKGTWVLGSGEIECKEHNVWHNFFFLAVFKKCAICFQGMCYWWIEKKHIYESIEWWGKPDFVDFACSCNWGTCTALSPFISRGIPFMFSVVTCINWFFASRELCFSFWPFFLLCISGTLSLLISSDLNCTMLGEIIFDKYQSLLFWKSQKFVIISVRLFRHALKFIDQFF